MRRRGNGRGAWEGRKGGEGREREVGWGKGRAVNRLGISDGWLSKWCTKSRSDNAGVRRPGMRLVMQCGNVLHAVCDAV